MKHKKRRSPILFEAGVDRVPIIVSMPGGHNINGETDASPWSRHYVSFYLATIVVH